MVIILEHKELVFVHLGNSEDDEFWSFHLQLQFVDVGICSHNSTHIETEVLFADHHPLAGQQVESSVVHIQAVVSSAIMSHCHHETLVCCKRSVETIRCWRSHCSTVAVLVA